ncbi:DUF1565 domain-containing protein [Cylindrospermopsis raciborskii]|uniref:DUF1565 domain-containing protein n=1 Tax=Cylindrospermopsis raciborskii TaxID=77022 RepID=UPI001BACBC2B|nr:DUF1565 domain-containing protein [Cylindrospermopsis raciborskii]
MNIISKSHLKSSVVMASICGSLSVTLPVGAQLPSVAPVIYVDPISGVNIVSTGNSVTNPYKTITFALEQAQPGTIIQLAPGSYTRDGIVITDSAQPLLRSNVVKDNERDGIVITLNSSPDLGTRSNPGGNVIVNNGRYNIYNAATTGVAISALGNTIDDSGILGEVEIDGIQITGNRKPVSSNDPNLALLSKWQLTAVSCSSTPVIGIFIGDKQYCVSPHPDLTAKAYEYNPTTGTLRALRTGPRPTKPGNL